MRPLAALGLMSGTSMDGIDLAAIHTDGDRHVARGPSMAVPYEPDFRRRIEAALEEARRIERRDERPGDLAALEREITMRHGEAVTRFLAGPGAGFGVEVIGFHGQTVLHRPQAGLTVQLGDGPLLARLTGLRVVHDMRAEDMRHGGQGAPLVPAYHAALAGNLPPPHGALRPVAFVNLGGIANVTFVPDVGAPVAFDTGPGNVLIDRWVDGGAGIPFDADGLVGSEGTVATAAIERYMSNPFFARGGPKSLDRNDFDLEAVRGLELADGARTLAALTATAIARAVEHLPRAPRLWVLSGGGRRNPHIVADLKAEVAPAPVLLAEEAGLDGDAMEAEAWAYLAARSLKRLPLTFPATTGCRRPVHGGVLALP